MSKQYRNKKTGKIVVKHGDNYIPEMEWLMPADYIENSDEWELVEDTWELKIEENKNIYIKNSLIEIEFHIGDKVTIKSPNISFGDGVRDHVISGFHIGTGYVSNSILKNIIHVSFQGYDPIDRTLPIHEIMKK